MKTRLSKTKKIISLLLALTVIVSSFAIFDIGFAYTRTLFLGREENCTTNGSEDMVMFKYVPESSGMYTFYQTNSRSSEAYLFIKEELPDGSKQYRQLAFSNRSPNFAEYGQAHEQLFCLTYHLEAGKTYYYGVVVPYPSVTQAEISVKLKLEKYDNELIDHIVAECPTSLTWYTDGEWRTDANGKQFFLYNISKLIANTTVTIYYTNGQASTATGAQQIDGLNISYNHNQTENHWYVPNVPGYTSNDFTVTVLNKSVTFNVDIQQGSLYPVKGKVIDYSTGEVVANAKILLNSQNVATTDDSGNFSFTSAIGTYDINISTDNSIDNIINIVVTSETEKNDYTQTPFKLITCDYVDDEVINAKDSAFVNSSDMAQDIKATELSEIDSLLGASKESYK